jgi:hypothetical protein
VPRAPGPGTRVRTCLVPAGREWPIGGRNHPRGPWPIRGRYPILGTVRRALTLPALALTTALAVTTGLAAWDSGALGAPSDPSLRTMSLGSPGHWNKISIGTVSSTAVPSVVRTADGVLHVVYSKTVLDGLRIGHTEVNTAGTVVKRNDVLADGWYAMDPSPVAVSPDGISLDVLFAGQRTQTSGFWSNGRIYRALSSTSGADWTLPADSVGRDSGAISTRGTAATTLEDGTPVAGFPLNDVLTWHVGTDNKPDQRYQVTPNTNCCMFDAAMTRTGSTVLAGWYQNGWNADGSGTFVKQIYPSVGGTLKAPGSTAAPATGPVAMATGAGGVVYVAYCAGSPTSTCAGVRVWKVGTNAVATVPRSKNATSVALSASPSGRLWVAWADSAHAVHAVRTDASGMVMGAVQNVGSPRGSATSSLAVEGSLARADIVLNNGAGGLWHTQALPGLSPKASKKAWRQHHKQTVVFTVRDANAPVKGAVVRSGSRHCRTRAKGTCAITFPSTFAKGKHTVRVKKPSYGVATVVVRVR